jgi:two-component system nitrate/nitrite response regulator NarL
MSARIRVLLVDDHTLFRGGIKSLLLRSGEFEVVGEAGDGLEGAKRAKQLRPDVILLDLHMPGVSGRDALRLIRDDAPDANVLMLTVSEDGEDLVHTLRNGAVGYLLKNISAESLTDAVRMASRGESVVSPAMMAKLVAGVGRNDGTARPHIDADRLTPREREILGYLATGQSNKEIARQLDLAESTVKIHVQGVLKKLGLTSRVQAAVFAVEHGLAQIREGG